MISALVLLAAYLPAVADTLRTADTLETSLAFPDSGLASVADSTLTAATVAERWLWPLGLLVLSAGTVVLLFMVRSKN